MIAEQLMLEIGAEPVDLIKQEGRVVFPDGMVVLISEDCGARIVSAALRARLATLLLGCTGTEPLPDVTAAMDRSVRIVSAEPPPLWLSRESGKRKAQWKREQRGRR